MGKAPAHKPDNPSSDPRTHFSLAEKEERQRGGSLNLNGQSA